MDIHTLQNSWIVWYHNPSDKDWGKDSYKDIIEITSIEDYCVLKNSWNMCLPKISEGMFFLMRKLKDGTSIYPQWEDTNNIEGGVWSFKIPKDKCEDIWFTLIKYVLGECLIKDNIEYSIINGISISPKKNFSIIKIWLQKNSIHNIENLLKDNLQFLNSSESLYSKHSSNIKKDKNKYSHNKAYIKKRSYKNKTYFNNSNQYKDFNNNCSW
jgi:hypothetical protein